MESLSAGECVDGEVSECWRAFKGNSVTEPNPAGVEVRSKLLQNCLFIYFFASCLMSC